MRLLDELLHLTNIVREYLYGDPSVDRGVLRAAWERADSVVSEPYPVVDGNAETLCRCDNCGHKHTLANVTPWHLAPDFAERLHIGHPLPAGECPQCGSWSYVYYDPPEGDQSRAMFLLRRIISGDGQALLRAQEWLGEHGA